MDSQDDSQFLALPNEMVYEIMKYLTHKELLVLSLVNQELFLVTKDVIEKQTIFKVEFPFPELDISMTSCLKRNYHNVSIQCWDFVHEFEKTQSFIKCLKYGPTFLHLQGYINDFRNSELFNKFIKENKRLKNIRINTSSTELLEHCLAEFPGLDLQVSKASLSVEHAAPKFNADFLEDLELFNPEGDHVDEINLIKNIGKFKNIKRFQTYRIKSAVNPVEVIRIMNEMKFAKLNNLKRLDLYYTEEITEKSPFLSLFHNLECLMCHFQNDEVEYSEDSFKFAQTIYANNEKTLKILILKIFGIPQVEHFLPNSRIHLNELKFLSCDSDTNEHTRSFLVQLLNQQFLHLEKLSLEDIIVNDEIILKILAIEKLNDISFRNCEIDFSRYNLETRFFNLRKLRISFSSINRYCLKSILENEQFKKSIEILHLDDFQMTNSEQSTLEQLNLPNLKCLVYKTYGDAEEVQHFINILEAPSLKMLKYGFYGFVWNSPPTFQKFSSLKVLVVQPIYKKIDDIKLLRTLEKLEILDIYVDISILSEILEEACAVFNSLRICKIKCHSKIDSFDEMVTICEKAVENKPFNLEIHVNENCLNFVKIIDLKTTFYIHLESSNVLYYYENLLNNFFDFRV